ncbi:MAG: DMT family transporter [Spirochaetes bacterium]|nr:DMT family transporter [Spirochaetota bacterium]
MYALLCALFLAIGDALVKNAPRIHPVTVAAGRIFFSLPVLWIIAIVKGIPAIDHRIVYAFILSPPLEVIALVLYMHALQISPMYRTLPFLAFTPLLLILTSWFMLGEKVTVWGALGIVCVVGGTYSLYFKPGQRLDEPLKTIVSDKGSLLMLAVAFLYSITANFGKMGVMYSSPSFFGAVYFTILTLILIIWSMVVDSIKRIFSKEILLIGITQGVMITFHMLALEIAPVSYMISVKRSSMLFGIIFGSLFFGEKNVLQHSIAALIILTGIGFISILG